MFNVGLTGNVAAGKSAVTSLLESWGATIIDADQIVRRLQTPGQPVFEAIVKRFGSGVVTADGFLDRNALRRIIALDDSSRASLNALVHPAVAREREAALATAEKNGVRVIINDIPLLFEVLDPNEFDAILLIDAPEPTRRARLISRRGISEVDANALIRTQMPAGEKRAHATWIIDNDGTLEDLENAARKIWTDIQFRAAESA